MPDEVEVEMLVVFRQFLHLTTDGQAQNLHDVIPLVVIHFSLSGIGRRDQKSVGTKI